ncbi:MAG: hypothetical protein ACRDL1_11005 [Solirubrobacterales bacterium]
MSAAKSPRAICPRTGLTVPECSCDRCLEDQIRHHMPALLERDANSADAASGRSASGLRRWRRAA